jgi:hypothetical protein
VTGALASSGAVAGARRATSWGSPRSPTAEFASSAGFEPRRNRPIPRTRASHEGRGQLAPFILGQHRPRGRGIDPLGSSRSGGRVASMREALKGELRELPRPEINDRGATSHRGTQCSGEQSLVRRIALSRREIATCTSRSCRDRVAAAAAPRCAGAAPASPSVFCLVDDGAPS